MKTLVKALLAATVMASTGYSQNINWRSLGEGQRNVLQLSAGYDYAATVGIGYHHAFTLVRPAAVGVDFAMPMGATLTDDFKVRLGGQVEAVAVGGFSTTVRVYSNFRRYQTSMVRVVSFGADIALLAGYYASTWYAAGEGGFDKAIATQLNHSDVMKENFPGIRDGWYVPTGGNWYYGVQGGTTIGEALDVSLRVGMTNAQSEDEDAVVPLYLQLAFGVRF